MSAVSSDQSIATVKLTNKELIVTSVAAGTAQITLNVDEDNDHTNTTKTYDVDIAPIPTDPAGIQSVVKSGSAKTHIR